MKKELLVILVLIASFLTACSQAPISQTTDISTAEYVYAIAKPAVVQIKARSKLTAQIPQLKIDDKGKISEVGKGFEMSVDDTSSGTGFIITPDGYIVTNAHVIEPAQDEVYDSFMKKAFDKIGVPEELRPAFYEYSLGKLEIKIQPIEVIVQQQVYGKDGAALTIMSADIKELGIPYPGKDVAILKVTKRNLPTVELGETDTPVGSDVFVIGYPGAANIGYSTESTVTKGILSAYKKSDSGWRLGQIDAAIGSGSSGGPVFDKKGKVIGIATLSAKVPGFNWMIPMEVVEEFITDAKITPERGPMDKIYERGLLDYWKGDYKDAVKEFHYVQEIMPNHPIVPEYLFYSRVAIEEESEKTYIWKLGAAIFGATILIITAIIFFIHELRANKKKYTFKHNKY